jgi:hypothetical protein
MEPPLAHSGGLMLPKPPLLLDHHDCLLALDVGRRFLTQRRLEGLLAILVGLEAGIDAEPLLELSSADGARRLPHRVLHREDGEEVEAHRDDAEQQHDERQRDHGELDRRMSGLVLVPLAQAQLRPPHGPSKAPHHDNALHIETLSRLCRAAIKAS